MTTQNKRTYWTWRDRFWFGAWVLMGNAALVGFLRADITIRESIGWLFLCFWFFWLALSGLRRMTSRKETA